MKAPKIWRTMMPESTLALLAVFVIISAIGAEAAEAAYGTNRDYVMEPPGPGNLSCYHCYHSVHGPNCLTMQHKDKLLVQHCAEGQYYCMVEKYLSDGQLNTFTRQCAESCDTGCAATTLVSLEKCFDCCRGDFCNTGDGSGVSKSAPRESSRLVALASLASLVVAIAFITSGC